MKIGVFDSGLGGLILLKAFKQKLPKYDFIYFGDTKNIPYGDKTPEEIFNLTRSGVEYLFKKDCKLVILACNTVSAVALRKLQKHWLPKTYPDRRILGVIVPTLEHLSKLPRRAKVGLLATKATVASRAYKKELYKLNPFLKLTQKSAPKLAPLLEDGQVTMAENELKKYFTSFARFGLDALVLGCTHYILLKKQARKLIPKSVTVVSQDEVVPESLARYLHRHQEIDKVLSKKGEVKIMLSNKTAVLSMKAEDWFGPYTKIFQA